MRPTSPTSRGMTTARAAWRSLWILVLSLAGTTLGQPPALAGDATPTGLEEWATHYPFQYGQWAESAHGVAYLEGDPNAPDCSGCHDDPQSDEQYTAAFRLEIPARCARCHADPETMKDSGLATDVYDTYRGDLHGRTIEYYRQANPGVQRFEAVCSDCHGSHTAYTVPATELTANCQSCHGNATARFSTASMGHFRADRQSPLVMGIRIFYLILIPTVLGGMLAYIGLDVWHRARSRRKGTAA
jgi:hypothetical protein